MSMDAYLPCVYTPVDNMPDRYTYTGGAVIYDDGKFLYSHHATDPCGGKLVNAFDMVRLHLYGDLWMTTQRWEHRQTGCQAIQPCAS